MYKALEGTPPIMPKLVGRLRRLNIALKSDLSITFSAIRTETISNKCFSSYRYYLIEVGTSI